MEVLGYFFIALFFPLMASAVSLAMYLLSPAHRLRPSTLSIVAAAVGAFGVFLVFGAMLTFLGRETVSPLTVSLAVLTVGMAAPILSTAFRRLS